MRHQSFAICSNRVVTPKGVKPAAVLVAEGRIADVVAKNQIPSDYLIEDVENLVVMPGLVDTHVHINEPGRTEWEGFVTATKAAAAGGITTLVDMPLNSSPVTTTPDAFREKLDAAQGKLFVDCGFYAGLIPENADRLPALLGAGVLGVKAFLAHSGIDEFPSVTELELRSAMPIIAQSKVPLLVHAELVDGNPKSQIHNSTLYSSYLSSRPHQWEQSAIELMIRLCHEYNCRTHIVHLSSADALPALKKARADGLPLTVETCPHYLSFSAEEIADGDTRFKCAPPLRERENRERLWEALNTGVIDFIVSDHSPCPREMKCLTSGDFQKAWGGIASLQLGLSIVWTEAKQRGFAVEDLARWMCRQPAEFIGIGKHKGVIARGFDADLVVWDPEKNFVVSADTLLHRHKLTPYEGRTLFGTIKQTYLHGRRVFDDGVIASEAAGQTLMRYTGEPSLANIN
jgi:allantoinase